MSTSHILRLSDCVNVTSLRRRTFKVLKFPLHTDLWREFNSFATQLYYFASWKGTWKVGFNSEEEFDVEQEQEVNFDSKMKTNNKIEWWKRRSQCWTRIRTLFWLRNEEEDDEEKPTLSRIFTIILLCIDNCRYDSPMFLLLSFYVWVKKNFRF